MQSSEVRENFMRHAPRMPRPPPPTQHVGRFEDDLEAARAYDRAALYLLGPHGTHFNFSAEEAMADRSPAGKALITVLAEYRQFLVVSERCVEWSMLWSMFCDMQRHKCALPCCCCVCRCRYLPSLKKRAQPPACDPAMASRGLLSTHTPAHMTQQGGTRSSSRPWHWPARQQAAAGGPPCCQQCHSSSQQHARVSTQVALALRHAFLMSTGRGVWSRP